MRRIAIALSVFVTLALAATASADNYAGVKLGYHAAIDGRYITYTVKLWAYKDAIGPRTVVTFTDCQAGHGLPVPKEPNAFGYHIGSLRPNSDSNLAWTVPQVPPVSEKPYVLKLVYQLPHGYPIKVCLHATATQTWKVHVDGKQPQTVTNQLGMEMTFPHALPVIKG